MNGPAFGMVYLPLRAKFIVNPECIWRDYIANSDDSREQSGCAWLSGRPFDTQERSMFLQ